MNKRVVVAVSYLGLLLAAHAPKASACGDKFLLLGRSIRYEEAYAAKHPASVLVYSNPATGFSAVAGDVTAILKKAGHKPVAAEGSAGLATALKSGTFDVAFADVADVDAVDAALRAAGSKAVLLAVIHAPTAKEKEAAEKQYSCLLSAKGKDKHFLAVVNEITRLRAKGREPDCKKA